MDSSEEKIDLGCVSRSNDIESKQEQSSMIQGQFTHTIPNELKPLFSTPTRFLAGRGSFGTVIVTDDSAWKIVNMTDDSVIEQATTESLIMASCRHPNLCSSLFSILYGNHLISLMDAGISLDCAMQQLQTYPDKVRFDIFAHISHGVHEALEYLHSQHIIHCDLKSGNILLFRDGRVQLGDFDVSIQLEPHARKPNDFCGTVPYMSPETLEQSGYWYERDYWSLGCIIVELFSGKRLFNGMPSLKIMMIIIQNDVFDHLDNEYLNTKKTGMFRGKKSSKCPKVWRTMIQRLLQRNPRNRIPTKKECIATFKRGSDRVLSDISSAVEISMKESFTEVDHDFLLKSLDNTNDVVKTDVEFDFSDDP